MLHICQTVSGNLNKSGADKRICITKISRKKVFNRRIFIP